MNDDTVKYILEKAGKQLPDEFVKYLNGSVGGSKYLVKYQIENENFDDDVWLFNPKYSEYIIEFDEYYGRMNMAYIPFGVVIGGDIYCVSLLDSSFGSIVRYGHDYLDFGKECENIASTIFMGINDFVGVITKLA